MSVFAWAYWTLLLTFIATLVVGAVRRRSHRRQVEELRFTIATMLRELTATQRAAIHNRLDEAELAIYYTQLSKKTRETR